MSRRTTLALLGLAALAATPGAAPAGSPASRQAAPKAIRKPVMPMIRQGGIPLRTRLDPTAGFRLPTGEEMKQFYAEFEEAGWSNVMIPFVPTAYSQQRGGPVLAVDGRRATLFGDVDGDERPEWVVGCYFPPAGAPDAAGRATTGRQDDRARLVIFKRNSAGEWKVRWRSPGLGYEFQPPRFNVREVENGLDTRDSLRPPLCLVDIDGDRRMEIVYQCWSRADAVGALPGILRYQAPRWVGVAPQADRFSLQDLDRDGKLEVITGSREVGHGTGDDDVPRVWRWNGREYDEASREFPRFYKQLAARYATYIQRMEASGGTFRRGVWQRAYEKAASLSG